MICAVFEDSGFKRTLCGSKWDTLTGTVNAFNNLGSGSTISTARYGCCPANKYMSSPEINPFKEADSCSDQTCPAGYYGSSVLNDETSCQLCERGKSSNAGSTNCDLTTIKLPNGNGKHLAADRVGNTLGRIVDDILGTTQLSILRNCKWITKVSLNIEDTRAPYSSCSCLKPSLTDCSLPYYNRDEKADPLNIPGRAVDGDASTYSSWRCGTSDPDLLFQCEVYPPGRVVSITWNTDTSRPCNTAGGTIAEHPTKVHLGTTDGVHDWTAEETRVSGTHMVDHDKVVSFVSLTIPGRSDCGDAIAAIKSLSVSAKKKNQPHAVDPWVSTVDHCPNAGCSEIVYGEAANTRANPNRARGLYVYVRDSTSHTDQTTSTTCGKNFLLGGSACNLKVDNELINAKFTEDQCISACETKAVEGCCYRHPVTSGCWSGDVTSRYEITPIACLHVSMTAERINIVGSYSVDKVKQNGLQTCLDECNGNTECQSISYSGNAYCYFYNSPCVQNGLHTFLTDDYSVGSGVFVHVNKIDPEKRSTIQCYRKEKDIVEKLDTSQPTQPSIFVVNNLTTAATFPHVVYVESCTAIGCSLNGFDAVGNGACLPTKWHNPPQRIIIPSDQSCTTKTRTECCKFADGRHTSASGTYYKQDCVPSKIGHTWSNNECQPKCWVEGTCGSGKLEHKEMMGLCMLSTTHTRMNPIFIWIFRWCL